MTQKIYPTQLPYNSLLRDLKYNDYSDSVGVLLDRDDINVDDLVNCFFTSSPLFVEYLMKLRDFMVKKIGLKTGDYRRLNSVSFQKGKEIGLFKMFDKNEREAIIGADDKHLNFRVSLYANPGIGTTEVLISTVVLYNNKFGKVYMSLIKPFHKVVVSSMIKQIRKSLMEMPLK